jgi:hypothetical protein
LLKGFKWTLTESFYKNQGIQRRESGWNLYIKNIKIFNDAKAEALEGIEANDVSTQELIWDRLHMSVYRDGGLGHSFFPTDQLDAISYEDVKGFKAVF